MLKIKMATKAMAFLAIAAVVLIGCRGNDEGSLDTSFGSSGNAGNASGNTGGNESNIVTSLPPFDSETLFQPAEDMEVVYFDYNSFVLRNDARAALERNVNKMKQQAGVIFQIAGHCDDRGTQEYNLALGEKRALATREYLMQLGIDGNRIITISYGEEAPIALGSDDSAWSKNRRCEFLHAM